jgi:Na+-driven multidrug efflux pump
LRGARSHGTSPLPRRAGILRAARAGGPLLIRTGLLRISLLSMTFVATSQGDVALASHQIAWTL